MVGTLGQGGAERQLYYMCKTLKAAGKEVQFICFTKNEYWHLPIQNLGVEMYYVQGSVPVKLFASIRLIKKIKPQIIQSMHFYVNVYLSIIKFLFPKAKTIGGLRNDLYKEMAVHGKLMAWLGLHGPQYMIANSLGAYQSALQEGFNKNKVFYLQNVVDTNVFIPKKENKGPHKIKLLAIGRLEKQKRFDRLFNILSQIKNPSFDLTLVGDGTLKNTLIKQSEEFSKGDCKVIFTGNVSDTSILYKDADIFILTSDFEGTPNVVLEAMASGLPVVVSAVGNLPSIIVNEVNGYILEPDDEQGFVRTIQKLMLDESLRIRIGNAARNFIDNNYSLQALSEKMNTIYKAII